MLQCFKFTHFILRLLVTSFVVGLVGLVFKSGSMVTSRSQQYPAASQAGPQAYLTNLLNDGASQVHPGSPLGVTPDPHSGQLELSQQYPSASQAGPHAYFLLRRVDVEHTQFGLGSTSTEQKEHSAGFGVGLGLGLAAINFGSAS